MYLLAVCTKNISRCFRFSKVNFRIFFWKIVFNINYILVYFFLNYFFQNCYLKMLPKNNNSNTVDDKDHHKIVFFYMNKNCTSKEFTQNHSISSQCSAKLIDFFKFGWHNSPSQQFDNDLLCKIFHQNKFQISDALITYIIVCWIRTQCMLKFLYFLFILLGNLQFQITNHIWLSKRYTGEVCPPNLARIFLLVDSWET